MPVGRRSQAVRLLTAGAIALAVIVVALLLFGGGGSYTVHATLQNASQLVTGDQVKVGGVPVGEVTQLRLDRNANARVTLELDDDELAPLHRGSRIEVRSVGLASIAGRYVALSPGPNDSPAIPAGGTIAADDTQAEVDLDAVLNTLNPRTLEDLQNAVQGLGSATAGRGDELNDAIHTLNPALSQTAKTAREVVRDQKVFERFVVEAADVVTAVGSRSSELERAVPAAGATLGAIADHTAALDEILRRLPPTLRQANTTLVNLRAATGDFRPAIRDARPVAAPLNEFLTRLRPVARRGVEVIPELRSLVDRPGREDLLGVVRSMPSVARRVVPAFDSAVRTVKDALPIVEELRRYAPDFVGGQLEGYGGGVSHYYDANGRFARISFQGSGYSLNNEGTLVPQPPTVPGLTGYRTGVASRCPGAATQPAPDKSNPWHPGGDFPCDPEDDPR